MKTDKYFQFPLCALSYGQTWDLRLNTILHFAIVDAGLKLWRKLSRPQQDAWFSEYRKTSKYPKDFIKFNEMHCAALYGAKVIGVTFHSITRPLEEYAKLRAYIATFVAQHGADAVVRIKMQWLFDARDHHGLDYREFAVLCAIYSSIGTKQLAMITRNTIIRRALGYRKAAIMQAELGTRSDGAKPLTERQLRDTVSTLHQNNFFARATYGRRITYYSIRLKADALRKAIADRRTYPGFFHEVQSGMDQSMTAAIQVKLREISKSAAKRLPQAP